MTYAPALYIFLNDNDDKSKISLTLTKEYLLGSKPSKFLVTEKIHNLSSNSVY